MTQYSIDVDIASDIGIQRDEEFQKNEDCAKVWITEVRNSFGSNKIVSYPKEETIRYVLAALADGHGDGGHIASKIAVHKVIHSINKFFMNRSSMYFGETEKDKRKIEGKLRNAITNVNQTLLKKKEKSQGLTKMGTTLDVLLMLYTGDYFIGHVGDGRIYRQDRLGMFRLTEDHSGYFEFEGKPTKDEELYLNYVGLKSAPRALGKRKNLPSEISRGKFQHGDTYVLMSDGIYNATHHDEISEILKNPQGTAQELVDRSNKPDKVIQVLEKYDDINKENLYESVAGADNASAIVIRID